jgi:hypothetical protein
MIIIHRLLPVEHRNPHPLSKHEGLIGASLPLEKHPPA